jgi:hypothetical protein
MTASSVDSVGGVGASRALRFYLNHFPLLASAAVFLVSVGCGCSTVMAISAVATAVAAYFYLRPTKIEGDSCSFIIVNASTIEKFLALRIMAPPSSNVLAYLTQCKLRT